jgi:opacity protein-like surface antigen
MMTRVLWAFIAAFIFAATAGAQINPQAALPTGFSSNSPDTGVASDTKFFAGSSQPSADLAADPFSQHQPPPQGVYGVFSENERQVSLGYTFVRFYEVPGMTANANGVDLSGQYFLRSWIAADAEILGTFGTVSGVSSHLVMGGVGPRLRWPSSGAIQLWAHGLAGFAYFSPRTPYGSTTAFGYELGGGVDFAPSGRFAYRVEGDALGSQFFSTYQLSPKISAAIVYKF